MSKVTFIFQVSKVTLFFSLKKKDIGMSQLSDNLAYTEAYYKVIWYIHVIYCIIKLHENYHIPIHTAIPVYPAQPKFAKLEKKRKISSVL